MRRKFVSVHPTSTEQIYRKSATRCHYIFLLGIPVKHINKRLFLPFLRNKIVMKVKRKQCKFEAHIKHYTRFSYHSIWNANKHVVSSNHISTNDTKIRRQIQPNY